VHIPRENIGRTIFEILAVQKTADRLAGREILIDPELVIRESTGIARQTQPIENTRERNEALSPNNQSAT